MTNRGQPNSVPSPGHRAARPSAPDWVTPPSYAGRCLGGVLPAAARSCGFTIPGPPGEWDGPDGDHSAVLVVLADGLGEQQLVHSVGHAPFLGRHPRWTMTAGFPSTTVTSLASFGTGLPPGETGLAGYAVRDPSTGRRTTLIGWETSTPPRVWQPHPTHFERITAAGCPAVFVGRRRFKDSAMTTASLRGAVFRGADSPLDRVEAAVQASRSGGVVYVYWGEIDKAGHEHGWQSWPWLHALEELDQSMAALRRALPASAALWLTSDHGMVDATAASTFDLADDPGMRQAVEIVAGEARAMHLYGPAPELIASSLRESLAERAWVLTKAEAVAEGLFGDHVSAHADQILGDVIVIAAGETAVVDSHTASPASLAMIGQHGSLTAAEMEIPLIEIPA